VAEGKKATNRFLHLWGLNFLYYMELQKSLQAVESGMVCLVCQSEPSQQMPHSFSNRMVTVRAFASIFA